MEGEEIYPAELPAGMAWFRTFMAGQGVYLCWRNKDTRVYRRVLPREAEEFGLETLETITRKIGEICRLILLSMEIALSRDGA